MIAAAHNLPSKIRPNGSGFTLIELMVTIAVFAIIVSIAAPNISSQLANQRITSTTATLAHALKEAKVESMIRRQAVTVSHDADEHTLTVRGSDLIVTYHHHSASMVTGAAAAITFTPDKRASATTTYTICDSQTEVAARQVGVTRLAHITTQRGRLCP